MPTYKIIARGHNTKERHMALYVGDDNTDAIDQYELTVYEKTGNWKATQVIGKIKRRFFFIWWTVFSEVFT